MCNEAQEDDGRKRRVLPLFPFLSVFSLLMVMMVKITFAEPLWAPGTPPGTKVSTVTRPRRSQSRCDCGLTKVQGGDGTC